MHLPIRSVSAQAYTYPLQREESDGTFRWSSTTIVVAQVAAGDHVGIGYTYTAAAAARLIRETLTDVLDGSDAMDNADCWRRLVHRLRNAGRSGVGACAVSALDVALWDLKAKALGTPLSRLLGGAHPRVEIYGSGGFTSMTPPEIERQLGAWASEGMRRVKMKVGRSPEQDGSRLVAARRAIGEQVELMVDANGAYQRKQALEWAERFADHRVTWFEEPVSSDDLAGLRLVRDRAPGGMHIAAGEYGYDAFYFRDLIGAGAVDVLQADATRCLGITGLLQADALCWAHNLRLSAHCAPAIHVHAMCGALTTLHLEYFHDHARLEPVFFDGVRRPKGGFLQPAEDRPGLGLELRTSDIERYESC